MTESTRTSRLLSRLRQMHPLWEVWKVNDRVAKGRPDVTIVTATGVWFVEFKRCGPTKDPRDLLTATQRHILNRLHALRSGRQVVVVGLHEDGTQTVYGMRGERSETSKTAFIDFFEDTLCSAA